MEFDQIYDTLAALPRAEQLRWGAGALGILVIMGLAFFLESRLFKNSGRTGSWLALRFVTLLMVPPTVAVLVLPARSVSGMEGLAVFYLVLFTLAPLLWFGSHVLGGRLLQPAIKAGESVALAISAIAIMAIPLTAFLAAQFSLQDAARQLASQKKKGPDSRPLAHAAGPVQRFSMPGAGTVFTQSLIAPPGLRLERVDQRYYGPWYATKGVSHPVFCTQGNDLHLMWSGSDPAPQLRLHWTQADGLRVRGEHFPDVAGPDGAVTKEFSIGFRPDGLDPVAPIPRVRVDIGMLQKDGTIYTHMLNPLQGGETMDNDCLMPGYQRVRWQEEGPIQNVGIMFYQSSGNPPLRGQIARPAVTEGSAQTR